MIDKILTQILAQINIQSVTAVSVVFLGIFQYRLARQLYKLEKYKIKLELYRKRYDIYEKLHKFLAIVVRKGTCTDNDLLIFRRDKKEVLFLFNEDIIEYLEEVYQKGIRIMSRGDKTIISPEESGIIIVWFGDQFEESTKKFKPYLDSTQL
jgi:hypothetical protein